MSVLRVKKVLGAEPDIVASIYSPAMEGYVHVYKDGHVRLEGRDRILDLGFDEEFQAGWWQFAYIQELMQRGVDSEELLKAIQSIRYAEEEIRGETLEAGIKKDFDSADEQSRRWCREKGIDYETLTDEEISKLADEAVHEWRKARR